MQFAVKISPRWAEARMWVLQPRITVASLQLLQVNVRPCQ